LLFEDTDSALPPSTKNSQKGGQRERGGKKNNRRNAKVRNEGAQAIWLISLREREAKEGCFYLSLTPNVDDTTLGRRWDREDVDNGLLIKGGGRKVLVKNSGWVKASIGAL